MVAEGYSNELARKQLQRRKGIAISDSFASIAWGPTPRPSLSDSLGSPIHTDLKSIQFWIVLVCLYLCVNNTTKLLGQFYSKER